MQQVRRALADTRLPLILLKATVNVAAGLPPASGHLFSDVGIPVPTAALGELESRLILHGWVSTHLDDYDQRYYRDECTTFRRSSTCRATVIDLHRLLCHFGTTEPGFWQALPQRARQLELARTLFTRCAIASSCSARPCRPQRSPTPKLGVRPGLAGVDGYAVVQRAATAAARGRQCARPSVRQLVYIYAVIGCACRRY